VLRIQRPPRWQSLTQKEAEWLLVNVEAARGGKQRALARQLARHWLAALVVQIRLAALDAVQWWHVPAVVV
jgi:hypothetical protein